MSDGAARLREALGGLDVPLRWLDRTDSTNADARAWADDGAPHGAVVVAERQHAGRGRQGRTWETPAGAVVLTMILRPSLRVAAAPLLCLGAAVATARVSGPAFRIKWPNDVLAPDGRKVAGILAELESDRGALRYAVVGVGLNVSAAPPLDTATHLEDADPRGRDRTALTAALIREILAETASVERDPAAMLTRWRGRSHTLGRRVDVAGVRGTAVDIDPDGALRVRTPDGAEQRILAGDVRMIG